MKRFFTILSFVAVMAASLLCTSCFKEKEQNYSFNYSCQYSIEDDEVTALLVDYFKTVSDGFFGKTSTYYGLSYDACTMAMADFEKHYSDIDDDFVVSKLKEGEYFYLVLGCTNNNQTLAYLVWTPRKDSE